MKGKWKGMEVKSKENNIKVENNLMQIIKGVLISLLSTIILLFIFSAILTYTNLSESFVSPVIIVLTGVSIFIGSSISNIKIKRNGLLNGALIGGIYIIMIYILSSSISMNFSINFETLILILTGMFCGIIGGILGVNKK